MRRREVLATLAGVGAAGVAGCSRGDGGVGDGPGDGDAEGNGTASPTATGGEPVVDDFERPDPLAAYRNPSGATWRVARNHVTSGDRNLHTEGTGYYELYSLPGDGLPHYPAAGDRFVGSLGVDGDNVDVLFGLDPGRTTPEGAVGYSVRVSPYDDSVALFWRDGSGKRRLARTTAPVERGVTYRVVVDWGGAGTTTATVGRPGGETVATVAATDDRRSGGGFGYRLGDFEAPVEEWFDGWRLG